MPSAHVRTTVVAAVTLMLTAATLAHADSSTLDSLPPVDTSFLGPTPEASDAPSCVATGYENVTCEFTCNAHAMITIEVASHDPMWPYPYVSGNGACGGVTVKCTGWETCADTDGPTSGAGEGHCEGMRHYEGSADPVDVTCASTTGDDGGRIDEIQMRVWRDRADVTVREIVNDRVMYEHAFTMYY